MPKLKQSNLNHEQCNYEKELLREALKLATNALKLDSTCLVTFSVPDKYYPSCIEYKADHPNVTMCGACKRREISAAIETTFGPF